jgi:hypothetical protein
MGGAESIHREIQAWLHHFEAAAGLYLMMELSINELLASCASQGHEVACSIAKRKA